MKTLAKCSFADNYGFLSRGNFNIVDHKDRNFQKYYCIVVLMLQYKELAKISAGKNV